MKNKCSIGVLAILGTTAFACEHLNWKSDESPPAKKSSPVMRQLIHSASAPTLSKRELYKKIAQEIALEEHYNRRRSDTLPPIDPGISSDDPE